MGTPCVRTFFFSVSNETKFSLSRRRITLVTFLSSRFFFFFTVYNLTPVCNLTPFTLLLCPETIFFPPFKAFMFRHIKRFRFVFSPTHSYDFLGENIFNSDRWFCYVSARGVGTIAPGNSQPCPFTRYTFWCSLTETFTLVAAKKWKKCPSSQKKKKKLKLNSFVV